MTRITGSPFARNALGENDRAALEARADELGVNVYAVKNTRKRRWKVAVSSGPLAITVTGYGPLAPIIAAGLDDWHEHSIAEAAA